MTPFGPDDLDRAEAASNGPKPRSKGTLPSLPDRDAPLSEHRDWLTRAFNPPGGYRFDAFDRHGRRLSNPAQITFVTPTGASMSYRFPEQRALAKPANLRASVVSLTDGLCRMPHLNVAESSDVWVELCSMAAIAADEAESDDFREHLDTFLAVAELEAQFTFQPPGRLDALLALRQRGWFERRHALQIATHLDQRNWERRPLLLVDSETGERWVRVNELATYLRHVVGEQMGHGVLDGFMAELGAARERFEVRRGALHLAMSFYRLVEADQ